MAKSAVASCVESLQAQIKDLEGARDAWRQECQKLQEMVEGLTRRVVEQSELLSRCAEKQ